jgi:hypothetical protein
MVAIVEDGPTPDNSSDSRSASTGCGAVLRMSESTYMRYARSVGTRPAEVCGWYRYPFSSRSLIVFRIVAGETPSPKRREMVREPAGSAVST